MSERSTTASATRKGPAKLGEDLDEVFAAKKETTAPRAPVSDSAAVSGETGRGERPQAVERDGVTSSTIRIPHYLSARISDYLHANKGDTLTTLVFKGLTKLGIEVEPDDLVPKRQRRSR